MTLPTAPDIAGHTKIICPKCHCLHWIPTSHFESMNRTRNDSIRINAFCPFGHAYYLLADNEVPSEPVKKEGNVVTVEFRK